MWIEIAFAALGGVILWLWLKIKEYLQAIHEADLKIVELQMTQSSDTMEAMLNDYLGEIQILRNTNVNLEGEIEGLQKDFLTMTGEMKKQKGRAASAHTQRGQLLEKWCPFLEHPDIDPKWEAKDWSFLGQPIDYLVFNWYDNKEKNLEEGVVVMLDVKSGKSGLTTKQSRIRDLVKAGKVEWREIRLD
jgi:predicted Holliday junction resolvase-like endonuclease